ncbi:hypothetical protein Q9966_001444, partial [Columba livia]
ALKDPGPKQAIWLIELYAFKKIANEQLVGLPEPGDCRVLQAGQNYPTGHILYGAGLPRLLLPTILTESDSSPTDRSHSASPSHRGITPERSDSRVGMIFAGTTDEVTKPSSQGHPADETAQLALVQILSWLKLAASYEKRKLKSISQDMKFKPCSRVSTS